MPQGWVLHAKRCQRSRLKWHKQRTRVSGPGATRVVTEAATWPGGGVASASGTVGDKQGHHLTSQKAGMCTMAGMHPAVLGCRYGTAPQRRTCGRSAAVLPVQQPHLPLGPQWKWPSGLPGRLCHCPSPASPVQAQIARGYVSLPCTLVGPSHTTVVCPWHCWLT